MSPLCYGGSCFSPTTVEVINVCVCVALHLGMAFFESLLGLGYAGNGWFLCSSIDVPEYSPSASCVCLLVWPCAVSCVCKGGHVQCQNTLHSVQCSLCLLLVKGGWLGLSWCTRFSRLSDNLAIPVGGCLRPIVSVVYRNSWGTSVLVTITDSGYQSAWPWVQCGAARRGFPSCVSSECVGIPRSSFPLAFLKTQFLEWHGHSLFVLHPCMFLDMCFWFRFRLS